MKLSEMVLNSMKAAAEYNMSFEAKIEYLQELSDTYIKAVEMEEMEAAAEYFGLNTVEKAEVVETKAVKKVTKFQTYLNATLKRMQQGLSLSEALEQTNRVEMKDVYIKTRRGYISKMKKHILTMSTTN